MRRKNRFILVMCFSFGVLTTGSGLLWLRVKSAQGQEVKQALSFIDVAKQSLNDPELKEYEVVSRVMEVPPKFSDRVRHHHDAELFGYVLEGEVEIEIAGKPVTAYGAGKMFYEPRNAVHSLLRNPSQCCDAKVLLFFVIKKGRAAYVLEKQ